MDEIQSMIQHQPGPFLYNRATIQGWRYAFIGIYYCGYALPNGNFIPLYIGRAVGMGGIRARLIQHLNDDVWLGVIHFRYATCSNAQEAVAYEAQEIARCQPKYNTQGKRLLWPRN
jgi:hypothetical protein